jgi:hypothetical protein
MKNYYIAQTPVSPPTMISQDSGVQWGFLFGTFGVIASVIAVGAVFVKVVQSYEHINSAILGIKSIIENDRKDLLSKLEKTELQTNHRFELLARDIQNGYRERDDTVNGLIKDSIETKNNIQSLIHVLVRDHKLNFQYKQLEKPSKKED